MHRTWKLATVALVVGVVGAAGLAFAGGSTHNEFNGTAGLHNPCNGENLSVSGPLDIQYHENAGGGGTHYAVHLTFKGTGSGSQGNSYRTSFVANQQFDTPSGPTPNGMYFDVPFHAQIISQGSASNFSAEGTLRVTVVNGSAVGAHFTSFAATKCKG